MNDVIRNYYSYYDEMENENPDLGLVFYWTRPDFPSEIGWFTSLFKDVMNGNAKCLVAEEDGHVVGLCDVHSKRPKSEVAHVGILGLAVIRDYRGKGIGRALLEAIVEACRGTFKLITLDVLDGNTRGYELYKKAGFVEAGRHPKALMRKNRYYAEINMYLELD